MGQNLVTRLKIKGYTNLVVIDKHSTNLAILQNLHPDVTCVCADLAEQGSWDKHFVGADVVVMLQAQIGGNDKSAFIRNNVDATRAILQEIASNKIPYLVHISSSVVESVANDDYTNTKKEQEDMVIASSVAHIVLRPTLMFGWFDRKHLGWLSRFMKKVPVFPIPGDGRYMRQPLYVGDFCSIIMSCIENKICDGVHNISGHEQVDYIDIIREIKRATSAKTAIINIPYQLFYLLLFVWGLFDKNPPFTTQQLSALVSKDAFEVTDWPKQFGVSYTPFSKAIDETFNHPIYNKVILEF